MRGSVGEWNKGANVRGIEGGQRGKSWRGGGGGGGGGGSRAKRNLFAN